MSVSEQRPRHPYRWAGIALGLLLVLLAAAACGGDSHAPGPKGFEKITPSETTCTIEDFLGMGFKKDKQYDIAELPAGVDAWVGFWGPDPYSRKQYELRFYASHEDAVEHGIALAEEVTGEDAAEYRKNPTWKEGAKDRWQSAIGATGAIHGPMPSGPSPRYGEFAIFGNVLMLCEGADSGQGLERCEALISALTTTQAE